MDDHELEQLTRDLAALEVDLFTDTGWGLVELDSTIFFMKQEIQEYEEPNSALERGPKYGNLVLTLAMLVAHRFVTYQTESGDLTEARKSKDNILRYNHNINDESHGDHEQWQYYKLLITRGDLILEFQALKARLVRLQAHQAQPLGLSHRKEISMFIHTEPPVAAPDSSIPASSLVSNAANSSVTATDSDNALLPSLTQLSSSKTPSTSPPTIPSSEPSNIDSWLAMLLGANDETEIWDYAYYCQVLAHLYFSRYETAADLSGLVEATQYMVTAYQLFADIRVDDSVFPNVTVTLTQSILRDYLDIYDAQSPHMLMLSINALETLKALSNHLSKSTNPLPHIWLDSPYQTETPTAPCINPPIAISESNTQVAPLARIKYEGLYRDRSYSHKHYFLPKKAELRFSRSRPIFPSTIFDGETSSMCSWITVLLNANETTDIRDYAIYCREIAEFHFKRYQIMQNALDVREAAEYSATAYQLLNAIADVSRSQRTVVQRTMDILFTYLQTFCAGYPRDMLPSIVNALETFGELVDHLPEAGMPPRCPWRYLLAKLFMWISKVTGNNLYADMAMAQYEKALEFPPTTAATPPNVDFTSWLYKAYDDLGHLLFDRYGRFGDSNDIDAAIRNFSLIRQRFNNPKIAGSLGILYWLRFYKHWHGPGSSEEDREQGTSCMKAVAQSGDSDAIREYSGFLPVFGDMLVQMYCQNGDEGYLAQGIEYLEKTNPQAVEQRSFLLKLAQAYRLRSAEGDEERVQQCCAAVFEDGGSRDAPHEFNLVQQGSRGEWKMKAKVAFDDPHTQFTYAGKWGVQALYEENPECLEAFHLMAARLPEIPAIGNKTEDKYERISSTQGYWGPAAAAAVKFATARLAVEWLELGMAVTVRQIYQLRFDAGDLAIQHPRLFQNLQKLSKELRQLSAGSITPVTKGLGALFGTNNHKLRSEYEANIEEIRRKPGFENFLRPLPFPQLAEAARYGPVILLSCDDRVTHETYAFIMLNPSQMEPMLWCLLQG
ncbi:hypothetical protein NP233_g7190 [Leucocoprinus birnbaumii]|uniref:Uncharacterized protein n=1 Tax=Leucocoprinus birnbaumii TaxID=56174 RepID=A0AAD5VPU3_9AGAR|nr:hypothetical protein NP233_g7190 [Leucocoprinus birnbaumii]